MSFRYYCCVLQASVRDRDGNTALHVACQRGDLSVVKSLTQPINVKEISEMFPPEEGLKQKYPCGRCPDVEQRNYLGKFINIRIHTAYQK